jgi:hypothetical protein
MLNKLKRNDIFVYDFRGISGLNMEICSRNHQSCVNWIISCSAAPSHSAISTLECDSTWRFSLGSAIFRPHNHLALLAAFDSKKKGRPAWDALL